MILSSLPGLYLFIEGNQLVQNKLERSGWKFSSVIDASDAEDAEIKFISSNLQLFNRAPTNKTQHLLKPNKNIPHHRSENIGLFPE